MTTNIGSHPLPKKIRRCLGMEVPRRALILSAPLASRTCATLLGALGSHPFQEPPRVLPPRVVHRLPPRRAQTQTFSHTPTDVCLGPWFLVCDQPELCTGGIKKEVTPGGGTFVFKRQQLPHLAWEEGRRRMSAPLASHTPPHTCNMSAPPKRVHR